MSCTRCGEKLTRDEAVWVMPGWPNPWNVQTSVPFHRGCVTA